MSASPKKDTFARRFVLMFSISFMLCAYPRFLFGIHLPGLFNPIENVWLDFLYRNRTDSLPAGDKRIIVLAVDQETGKEHGFPLPRGVYAKALDKMKALGVKTVVFDIMFFDKREAAGDAALGEATKRFGKALHLFSFEPVATNAGIESNDLAVSLPIPQLLKSAEYLGYPNIDSILDGDSHLRRARVFEDAPIRGLPESLKHGLPAAPSMDAVAYVSYTGTPLKDVYERYGSPKPRVMHLYFRGPKDWDRHAFRDRAKPAEARELIYSPYRRISMMDLLAGTLTDEEKKALKGALVMIGSTALGYFDHYPTPFVSQAPGVEYHANLVDNMINGDFLKSPPAWVGPLASLLFILLPLLLLRATPALSIASAAGVLALWMGTAVSAFLHGARLEAVAPAAGLIISFLVLTAHRVRTEGAEKKMIKAMFGQFVSPEVVEELANNPDKAKLGAQKRNMTVFFLDIAHFTTISEKMGPEALISFLNKYLSALSVVILDRGGTIDKYIGDCVMAFWNAPLESVDHRGHAIRSALQCQTVIDELNKDLDPGLPETPAIRIGLNTGDMNVGFTGTDRKLAYTVIGDEVNLASRLEGANKFFGSKIIASGATYEPVKDQFVARFLGRARVVGKATPVPVWEPLAEAGKLPPAWAKALPVWEKGTKEFFDKKYDAALASFEEFAKLMPGDGPCELYLNLARDYSALPPDDWDQVFNLTAK